MIILLIVALPCIQCVQNTEKLLQAESINSAVAILGVLMQNYRRKISARDGIGEILRFKTKPTVFNIAGAAFPFPGG